MKRLWAKLALGFAIAIIVCGLIAAANSYVTVTASSATVICLGADFLVIPDDPFSSSAINVSVSANTGWILTSPSSLSIVPGKTGGWSVKGDEDNPEDRAAGKIYVAKVELDERDVEVMRGDSQEVSCKIIPELAKPYIEISVIDDPVVTDGANQTGNSGQDISVLYNLANETIEVDNTISPDRELSGDDVKRVRVQAKSGCELFLVRLKKDVCDLWAYIRGYMSATISGMLSCKNVVKDYVLSKLTEKIPVDGMTPQEKSDWMSSCRQVAEGAGNVAEECVNTAVQSVIDNYDQRMNPVLKVDESWTPKVTAGCTCKMTGGALSFSNSGLGTSAYNWTKAVTQSGFDSSLLQIQDMRIDVSVSANGSTAYGKGSLTITGFININKNFMDGGDLNIGNSGTVSCGMEVKFKLDF